MVSPQDFDSPKAQHLTYRHRVADDKEGMAIALEVYVGLDASKPGAFTKESPLIVGWTTEANTQQAVRIYDQGENVVTEITQYPGKLFN